MKIAQWVWFFMLATVLPSILSNTVFGQEQDSKPLTTDRPTFTTDSNLVAPSETQLEIGFTHVDLEHGDANVFPEAVLRIGAQEDLEWRIGWAGYSFGDPDDLASGIDLGFKWKFQPGMALIGTFTLPTGHGPNDFDYEFLIGWNQQLDENSSLAGSFGIGAPTDMSTGDRFAQGIMSVMYSRSLDSSTSYFGEFYTNFPAADGEDAEYVVQTGLTHLLSDDMQVDCRIGFGLNDQAPDWLIGVGFSYRF